jgi:hypothetical protein
MTMTFNQVLSRRGTIQLYGTSISDLPATEELGLGANALGPIGFAQIRAFSFGKRCVELTLPAILTVFGPGRVPETWDTCARDKERVWEVGHGDPAVLVDFRRGTTLDLLDDVETRGIDGGVALENPRVENGQICATLHVWASIEIFGASASIDERIPVCMPIEGCVTVYEFGFRFSECENTVVGKA